MDLRSVKDKAVREYIKTLKEDAIVERAGFLQKISELENVNRYLKAESTSLAEGWGKAEDELTVVKSKLASISVAIKEINL